MTMANSKYRRITRICK